MSSKPPVSSKVSAATVRPRPALRRAEDGSLHPALPVPTLVTASGPVSQPSTSGTQLLPQGHQPSTTPPTTAHDRSGGPPVPDAISSRVGSSKPRKLGKGMKQEKPSKKVRAGKAIGKAEVVKSSAQRSRAGGIGELVVPLPEAVLHEFAVHAARMGSSPERLVAEMVDMLLRR